MSTRRTMFCISFLNCSKARNFAILWTKSPEQVRGHATDHRSDIFSFGLILYEMITGKRAFQHETMAETMSAKEPEEIGIQSEHQPLWASGGVWKEARAAVSIDG
ncbi:MAG: protein kinase [Acidobacteria bacterium]|nr:protein kinase [Acidobacteriota bacterium]